MRRIRTQMSQQKVIKVCFFGPESTGKTTMAGNMAQKFKTVFVPEVAREIITSNNFTIDDILRIGQAQLERTELLIQSANRLLICDTDLITTQIYAQHYLGEIPEQLKVLERFQKFDEYFLFDIDVPWVGDGLRDLNTNENRKEMFSKFKNALEQRNINYHLIQGNYQERSRKVENLLNQIINR
jgi:HTH-type transcriptional repressor of NAD biosynthesis genes